MKRLDLADGIFWAQEPCDPDLLGASPEGVERLAAIQASVSQSKRVITINEDEEEYSLLPGEGTAWAPCYVGREVQGMILVVDAGYVNIEIALHEKSCDIRLGPGGTVQFDTGSGECRWRIPGRTKDLVWSATNMDTEPPPLPVRAPRVPVSFSCRPLRTLQIQSQVSPRTIAFDMSCLATLDDEPFRSERTAQQINCDPV